MTEEARAGDPRCVLLLDEMTAGEAGEHCDRLMHVCESKRRAELVVSFATESTDTLDFAGLSGGRQPAKRGAITVGETIRTVSTGEPNFADPLVEAAVSDPSDLQELGQRISQFCQVWTDAGYEISVCFDSLSGLLAANETEVVFQFCHVLAGRLRSVGAVAHFHLDPNSHGQHRQLTFEQIFDETVLEEIDAEHLVPTRRSRATDRDVADSTETLTLADPTETTSAGDSTTGSTAESETRTKQASSSGEASDEDIADALPD
ncbi:DUF7504 family protein [Haloarchaeobius sp. DFWS5]|uniref:DUF7504 family protein n=1 Tax=Haloarchaeobius sp. DFWS5 TaxID=3446114 RepID=UPI003EBC465A